MFDTVCRCLGPQLLRLRFHAIISPDLRSATGDKIGSLSQQTYVPNRCMY